MSANPNLSIWCGRATPESLDAVEEAFRRADDPKDRALLDWQYLGHLGGAYLAIAHDERGLVDGVAATYAALPSDGFDGTSECRFIQSIDTLTLPEFRGQGLVGRLGSAVYQQAHRDGACVVYGFPNDAVLSTRVKSLDWSIMDPLPMLVRPIGVRYPLVRAGRRTPRVLRVDRRVVVPSDLDEWTRADTRVGVRRSSSFLSWRLTRPGSTYHTHERRDRHGRLLAWGVSEIVLKHGCALGYVIEIAAPPGNDRAARSLVARMTAQLAEEGADLVLAWALPGLERSSLLRNGFVPIPERLRPINLHFGVRDLSASCNKVNSKSAWRLTHIDSDTV